MIIFVLIKQLQACKIIIIYAPEDRIEYHEYE